MTGFWEANRAALGRRRDPEGRRLAALLGEKAADDWGLKGRDGRVLPGWLAAGRPRALVSTYDPAKEAERWAEPVSGGTVAVWGGAGTAAAEALDLRGVRLAFWVEPRLEVWRSLLTCEDWTPWIQRDDWVPLCTMDLWAQSLRDRYHPLWDGAFRTLEWRSAVQGAGALWDGYRTAALAVLDDLAADTSTQARFGERWYRNTLANLKRLKAGEFPGCQGAKVVVAGAGPGLEDALAADANRRWLDARPLTGDKLFATDTALPALVRRGITPDLVLCLDGQLPSYHHFVAAVPAVTLAADLASIPFLGRLAMPQVRFLSGHPFGTVVRRWFPELPGLDGSLGNVSGLGRAAALALGAGRVDAWGVDFAYRDGQTYARGTYVYDLVGRRANRLTPWESRLGAACYGAAGLERTWDAQGRALDTTPQLRDYRKRWEAAPSTARPVRLAHGEAGSRWPAFVDDWRLRLQNLPLPPRSEAVHSFVRTLGAEQRSDWWALWPLALALHRQGVPEARLASAVVERALSFLQD